MNSNQPRRKAGEAHLPPIVFFSRSLKPPHSGYDIEILPSLSVTTIKMGDDSHAEISPRERPSEPPSFSARDHAANTPNHEKEDGDLNDSDVPRPSKWSMGILNVPDTHEVPGKISRQSLCSHNI